MPQQLSTNTFTTAKWIVSATASDGTHTTIASALTSASSGDTIFIRPGTYTENLTLKAGVNLTAYGCDSSFNGTGKVIISGTCTFTAAGSVTISGIQLQTNSAALLAVTGSAASVVNLFDCYLNCTNNTGITFSSSSASSAVKARYCGGDLGTTGIGLYTDTASGTMDFRWCKFTNSGGSSTASSTSTANVGFTNSQIDFPLSTSSTGNIGLLHVQISTSTQNATCITTAGTGSSQFQFIHLESGTASAISVGAGTGVTLTQSLIDSTNTNALTGAGTINVSDVTFLNSVVNNTTTQGSYYTQLGRSLASKQVAFLAMRSATVLNVTGNNTLYTPVYDTEVYDIQSNYDNTTGTFTAPVTGKYVLFGQCYITGCTVCTGGQIRAVTSNRTYLSSSPRAAGAADCSFFICLSADMDAADTATLAVLTGGEAGATDDLYADDTTGGSYFGGYLLG